MQWTLQQHFLVHWSFIKGTWTVMTGICDGLIIVFIFPMKHSVTLVQSWRGMRRSLQTGRHPPIDIKVFFDVYSFDNSWFVLQVWQAAKPEVHFDRVHNIHWHIYTNMKVRTRAHPHTWLRDAAIRSYLINTHPHTHTHSYTHTQARKKTCAQTKNNFFSVSSQDKWKMKGNVDLFTDE